MLKLFKPRNLVILHGWEKIGKFPWFVWHHGRDWLMLLYGITFNLRNDGNKSYVSPEPVYVPFFVIEKHTGQIIVDIHAWSSSCLTINFQRQFPWVWCVYTSKFFYMEADE